MVGLRGWVTEHSAADLVGIAANPQLQAVNLKMLI
jgi:hypothetical protein